MSQNGDSLYSNSFCFQVEDPSQVGSVRRFVQQVAQTQNLSAEEQSDIAIVINELGSNILNHAQRGEVIVRWLPVLRAMEVLAIDAGPGMMHVGACQQDGFTSKSSSGTGLGAVRRQSDEFDIYSEVDKGTVIVSRIYAKPRDALLPWQIGAVCVPFPGEQTCGDIWSASHGSSPARLMVADGLGHGLLAHKAAEEAMHVFEGNPTTNLNQLVQMIHGQLRGTRGAALSMAEISADKSRLSFVGVGNVRGLVCAGSEAKSLMSHNGTMGVRLRGATILATPWHAGDTLILHSDGLSARWQLADYSELLQRHPSVVAGVLYRDHKRLNDDVTVVVGRLQ